jgi:hypothetical protein
MKALAWLGTAAVLTVAAVGCSGSSDTEATTATVAVPTVVATGAEPGSILDPPVTSAADEGGGTNPSTVQPGFTDGRLTIRLPSGWSELTPRLSGIREEWESVGSVNGNPAVLRVLAEDVSELSVENVDDYGTRLSANTLAQIPGSRLLDRGPIDVAGRDAFVVFAIAPGDTTDPVLGSVYLLTDEIGWEISLLTVETAESAAVLLADLVATVSLIP